MSKTYYECHVTMLGDPETIRPHVESRKWKFSAIDGDPVLGEGLKCYATRLFSSRFKTEDIVNNLLNVADELSKQGCNVLRRKVELVIYDDKSSKVRCVGGCADCHIDDLCK
jgi:hypothetical protein